MTATTDRCPGCHGSGIEMSGVTYAGMSETRRRSERRAWAVWDRKRRARRKR